MTTIDINMYLAQFAGKAIYYCPNPGNAGDSMIAHATFELFQQHNIDYRLFNWKKFSPKQTTIIYGGGGSLIPMYSLAQTIIGKLCSGARRFVILPQTINAEENFLRDLGSNVEIICREEISYRHVQRHANKAKVMIADDLAFQLNAGSTLLTKAPGFLRTLLSRVFLDIQKSERRHTFPPVRQTIGMKKFEMKNYLIRLSDPEQRSGVLKAFREDAEKVPALIVTGNVDVSKVFTIGTRNEQIALYATKKLLNFVNQFSEVRTNRLHVCIAAALLGKTVKLYPNNCYKCEAVYNYSMKNRFRNVQWMGGTLGVKLG